MDVLSDVDLKTRILIALAGLTQENFESGGATDYFSTAQINQWIEKRLEIEGPGRERGLKTKLNAMREERYPIQDDFGNHLGEVSVLVHFQDGMTHKYKISGNTSETRLSAKLLIELKNRRQAVGGVPANIEKQIVSEIYEEFKPISYYQLSNINDVAKIIDDAINGLYFTRDSNGLLKPTTRFALEQKFLELLSSPLPKPVRDFPGKGKKPRAN